MKLSFTKMHGCGNDYIFFNCFESEPASPASLSVTLSDRHTGIGGDGIILILPSDKADAKMRMFNSDGSEAGMCGNGIRCLAKYLYDNGIVNKERVSIETGGGIRDLRLNVKDGFVDSVTVDMGPAELRPQKIPVSLPGDNVIARTAIIGGEGYKITCVSVGNPHAVTFHKDIKYIDLHIVGPLFENDALFPERVNAEFVRVINKNDIEMRVWERGSGETMACGTGACASAVAAALNGFCDMDADIKVRLRGGELIIRYTDSAMFMTGNCVKVFDGTVYI